MCTARKISSWRTKFVLEEFAPDGRSVVRKMRMQSRKAGSDQIHFHPIPTSMGDKEAAKYEAQRVFMTATKNSSLSTTVTLQKKKDDPINPVFLAFLYGLFATNDKRDSDTMNTAIYTAVVV